MPMCSKITNVKGEEMERNAFFDNAKLVLIFGRVWACYSAVQGCSGGDEYIVFVDLHFPYASIYFSGGFFAKGSGKINYMTKMAKKLLLPYFIFQLLYTGYFFLIGKEDWQAGMFYPHWSLWFLFSLFCWHLLLAWFKKLPAATGLAISIGIGLIVGLFGDIGHTFSLSRTFVFFHFSLGLLDDERTAGMAETDTGSGGCTCGYGRHCSGYLCGA